MLNAMEIRSFVLFVMYLYIASDQTLACSTMHDFCQTNKRFQRVTEMSTVETEKAYDLLLQRICAAEDTIRR